MLVKAQIAVGKQKKIRPRTIFNMAAMTILNFRGLIMCLSKACVEMHRTEYGHTRIILGHFWYVTFGTPGMPSTLGIIPSEF